MASLDRARSTVAGYLCEFIAATSPTSIDRWVTDATYDVVARAVGEIGADRLRPIFERLDAQVPYDDFRLVMTHLEVRSD